MAHRTFTDSFGRRWEAWTVMPSRVERRQAPGEATPARGAADQDRRVQREFRVVLGKEWAKGWLAFQTDGEKRRLAPYPEGWLELTDEELEDLCRQATPTTPPRRLIE